MNETEIIGYYLFSNDFYSGNCKDLDLFASFYATYGILNSGVWEYTFDVTDLNTYQGKVGCDSACGFCDTTSIDCITCADPT